VWHIFDDEPEARIAANPVLEAIGEESIICSAQNIKLQGADNRVFAVEHTAAPIRDETGQIHGGILIFRDVTEVRMLASQLSYQASHDTLTGLVNRREFEIRLQHALDSARAEHRDHTLCYIDLDQFKVINDTCGHAAGDELLKQVANAFKAELRDNDTLARLGGDEFGVLLEGCIVEKAIPIVDKLRGIASAIRFSWDDKQFEIGVSIGVVPVTSVSGNLADLLSAADSACYEAKDQGRNRHHVYDPKDINIQRRQGEMHWVHRINDALEAHKFILYCQPIRPSNDVPSHPPRYELLLRMRDDDGKLIPPTAFLPAAERYNLMSLIDKHVVRRAMAVLQEATAAGQRLHLTVNVSGQSLSEESFFGFMEGLFGEYNFPPQLLTFEITETAAVSNYSRAAQFISIMKDKGCLFALDDFGSGLSSFAYLKNLPVDFIKIDGSFIRDIIDDSTDRAFVESIHQIASIMGLKTIAEYVESEKIASELGRIGVDYLQGMHVGKPVALDGVLQGLGAGRGMASR
jgi:diguanylate cyclase (GGDEF)-like protein